LKRRGSALVQDKWSVDMDRSKSAGAGAVVNELAVRIVTDEVELEGDLGLPAEPRGVVLFAHGSGSSRHSPRNRQVAARLHEAGFATLLMDLLTRREEELERYTGHLRFDIRMLSMRLVEAVDWLGQHRLTRGLALGCFGASTGAAAALVAAAERPEVVRAVVSRGGRPDLAGDDLVRVRAPTLLIVGGRDVPVITLNEVALNRLSGTTEKQLYIVPDATHLFEEPGALEQVARLASEWFERYLTTAARPAGAG